MQMLEAGHHDVTMREDFHKLTVDDLLVPFSGDYRRALDETEMVYYDYYEDKRHARFEEAQNIVDYLAKSGTHPWRMK